MAQFSWTLLSDKGRKYHIGLYHGSRTGHLLIHCNARILVIDFGVKESKTYSFFLDEDLCRVRLEREGERMQYHFELDRETDTPRNRARKKQDKIHLLQSLSFFGLLFALAIFLYFMLRRPTSQSSLEIPNAEWLAADTRTTTGRIHAIKDLEAGALTYRFRVNRVDLQRSLDRSDLYRIWGKLARETDEFQVTHEAASPFRSRLELARPTVRQLRDFELRVTNRHLADFPNTDSTRYACFVHRLVQLGGPGVLPDLFHSDTPPSQNPFHNRKTYRNRLDRLLPKLEDACRPPSAELFPKGATR